VVAWKNGRRDVGDGEEEDDDDVRWGRMWMWMWRRRGLCNRRRGQEEGG